MAFFTPKGLGTKCLSLHYSLFSFLLRGEGRERERAGPSVWTFRGAVHLGNQQGILVNVPGSMKLEGSYGQMGGGEEGVLSYFPYSLIPTNMGSVTETT